jgi:murein DD-endopeptidase MepM/ murein hydrolase activator NlpD
MTVRNVRDRYKQLLNRRASLNDQLFYQKTPDAKLVAIIKSSAEYKHLHAPKLPTVSVPSNLWVYPFDPPIVPHDGEYGNFAPWRKNVHLGVDYPCGIGTPVKAMADGIVVGQGYAPAIGNYLTIKAHGLFYSYCHLRDRTKHPLRAVVKQGQIVAVSGMTGIGLHGAHLHTTLSHVQLIGVRGQTLDPLAYCKTH